MFIQYRIFFQLQTDLLSLSSISFFSLPFSPLLSSLYLCYNPPLSLSLLPSLFISVFFLPSLYLCFLPPLSLSLLSFSLIHLPLFLSSVLSVQIRSISIPRLFRDSILHNAALYSVLSLLQSLLFSLLSIRFSLSYRLCY